MAAATINFKLYTGPVFVGSMVNWGLLGTLCLQIYSFAISFPNERLGIKCFVYFLLLLEIVQTGLATHWGWFVLVQGWGTPNNVASLNWSSITIPISEGLVSIIVQTFFAWRVYILRRNSWIFKGVAILIVLVSLMQGLSAMVNGIRFFFYQSIADVKGFSTGVTIWLSGSLACDVLVAASMVTIVRIVQDLTTNLTLNIIQLHQAKTNSPFKRTETLITKLIVHTVETGVVTVITAIVDLSLYIKFPDTFIHIVPALVLGKLYTNIALANLNGRTRHRVWGDQTVTASFKDAEAHQLSRRVDSEMPRTRTVVQISTSVTEERDEFSFKEGSPTTP
ncbi:hypothetical protein AX15_002054 [Amanita polypyramis BW_CC]|nr:hypothetical protein AX15_002054 [Amanita polypyramis BW_CC]